jgi:transposase
MLTLSSAIRIYLADGAVDMRKGIDGLVAIVRNQWRLDIFSGHLFIFLGRRSDRIKILYFERGGFVMWQKRLEQGRFIHYRLHGDGRSLELDAFELSMLLEGFDFSKVKRPKRFMPVEPEKIAA